MLLAMDVGNSSITVAIFDKDVISRRFHRKTERSWNSLDYAAQFSLVDVFVTDIIISSVVPTINEVLRDACLRAWGRAPRFVPADVPVPIGVSVHDHDEVGPDLLVNAYAAWNLHKCASIIVDMGTATTVQAVVDGAFLGVAIAPGLEISARALFDAASMLSHHHIDRCESVLGKNTIHAINSGVFLGHAAMIDGLVAKMQDEIGERALVIATGGIAQKISGSCSSVDMVDSDLTLSGLRLLYQNIAS